MAKSTMLIDAMNNILVTKSEEIWRHHIEDPNFKDFTGFICRKYMTMSPDPRIRQIVMDNYVQLERFDDKNLYLWLLRSLPKQKSGFIKFLK
jgi:hypothetical protein